MKVSACQLGFMDYIVRPLISAYCTALSSVCGPRISNQLSAEPSPIGPVVPILENLTKNRGRWSALAAEASEGSSGSFSDDGNGVVNAHLKLPTAAADRFMTSPLLISVDGGDDFTALWSFKKFKDNGILRPQPA
eukprot:NODE_8271_length_525_cov_5.869748_g7215_i0.p1 GENE.NODE_8271_length_525_cov_5.869748_g7215_i0~~NODE_8271_length_525_cov_5.869748_g7215_i0.p1  ORF type:complete len:155 (+),score=9.99 NODE_8271_length_525_cov_5.869748_g7215_i0:62-466(+)